MRKNIIIYLTIAHIIILCLSNILVQYPFILFGFHCTWGAFSYPLIFILTDLSTRLLGQYHARQIVFFAMIPALICSLLISLFVASAPLNFQLILRIAFASFAAYLLGQLLDISIFQRLRGQKKWWVAPSIATIFGNLVDTYVFFFIAFYQSLNPFLSQHWFEIANVDFAFKMTISLLSFIPLYGLLLKIALNSSPHEAQSV